MVLEILGLAILLLLSGFFSSSELAFVVANKLKIELRARKKNIAANNILYFTKHPQTFFSTILISNNVINISFASLLTIFLYKIYDFSDPVILLISTVLLLLFGELIPKYLANEHPDGLIMVSAIPIKILSIILIPLVKLTNSVSLLFIRKDEAQPDDFVVPQRDEIQSLIDEGSEVGNVDEEDSDIIKNIIDLGDQKVYEAMTPRTDMVGVKIEATVQEALDTFMESGYSKLPVYEENLDNIKGFIHVYDMFSEPDNIKEIIREVLFVPETKKSLDMLREFLDKRVSVTIVVDEFGGTAGILTVEDIIEEMFGEIRDEYDDDPDVCKKIDENTFVLNGKIEIDYLNEEYELNIPEGDYETIAGYITSKIGRIPTKGEKIKIDNFQFIILHTSKIRINMVKMYILPIKNDS